MVEERTTLPTRGESPESANAPVKRRRRRRTAACMQCRSRKLKCDQEYPTCGRCAKGPRPKACAYQDGSRPGHQNASPESSRSQMPMAGLEQGPSLGVASGNGIASSRPPKPPLQEKRPMNQESFGPSNCGIYGHDEPGILHLPRRDVPFIEQVLQPSPPLKRRRALIDDFEAAHRHPNQDNERMNRDRDQKSQLLEIPTRTYWRGKEDWSRFYGSSIVFNIISEVCLPILYISYMSIVNSDYLPYTITCS
jgi:hypothetical protein